MIRFCFTLFSRGARSSVHAVTLKTEFYSEEELMGRPGLYLFFLTERSELVQKELADKLGHAAGADGKLCQLQPNSTFVRMTHISK